MSLYAMLLILVSKKDETYKNVYRLQGYKRCHYQV